jgi:hypothetical protein
VGFLRAPDGTITVFDVPGAGTGPGQGTIAFCDNDFDAITGYYIDGANAYHGFLRSWNFPLHPSFKIRVSKAGLILRIE